MQVCTNDVCGKCCGLLVSAICVISVLYFMQSIVGHETYPSAWLCVCYCLLLYHTFFYCYSGQTCSGKTFTMLGPGMHSDNFQHEMRGVIPRSFETLFNLINNEKELVSNDSWQIFELLWVLLETYGLLTEICWVYIVSCFLLCSFIRLQLINLFQI